MEAQTSASGQAADPARGAAVAPQERCRKRGPYLPVGDTDWECLTHNVELVRVTGDWDSQPKRTEMACPAGEPDRIPADQPRSL